MYYIALTIHFSSITSSLYLSFPFYFLLLSRSHIFSIYICLCISLSFSACHSIFFSTYLSSLFCFLNFSSRFLFSTFSSLLLFIYSVFLSFYILYLSSTFQFQCVQWFTYLSNTYLSLHTENRSTS